MCVPAVEKFCRASSAGGRRNLQTNFFNWIVSVAEDCLSPAGSFHGCSLMRFRVCIRGAHHKLMHINETRHRLPQLMQILTPESSRSMPWANGLGSTLEIATDAHSHHAQSDSWTWRLSVADVPTRADFSKFPGVDRWIACLHGDGMRIERSSVWTTLPNSGDALSFAGEEIVTGDPIGPNVQDVNWFLRRNCWQGGMRVHRETESTIVEGEIVVIHGVSASTGSTIRSQGQSIKIATGHTLITSARVIIESDPESVLIIAWASAR